MAAVGCARFQQWGTQHRFTFSLVNPSGNVAAAGPAPQKVSRKSAAMAGSYTPAAGARALADRCRARLHGQREGVYADRGRQPRGSIRQLIIGGWEVREPAQKNPLVLTRIPNRICSERPPVVAARPEEGS